MAKFDPRTLYDIVPDQIVSEDFHKYAEEFVVRPPYQRKSVWSARKQQDLLDSLFRFSANNTASSRTSTPCGPPSWIGRSGENYDHASRLTPHAPHQGAANAP